MTSQQKYTLKEITFDSTVSIKTAKSTRIEHCYIELNCDVSNVI